MTNLKAQQQSIQHLAKAEVSLDPGTEQLHNCTRQLQLESQQLLMQLLVVVFSCVLLHSIFHKFALLQGYPILVNFTNHKCHHTASHRQGNTSSECKQLVFWRISNKGQQPDQWLIHSHITFNCTTTTGSRHLYCIH